MRLASLIHTLEVPCSYLDPVTDYPETFRGFPHSFRAHATTMRQLGDHRLLPHPFLNLHLFVFHFTSRSASAFCVFHHPCCVSYLHIARDRIQATTEERKDGQADGNAVFSGRVSLDCLTRLAQYIASRRSTMWVCNP